MRKLRDNEHTLSSFADRTVPSSVVSLRIFFVCRAENEKNVDPSTSILSRDVGRSRCLSFSAFTDAIDVVLSGERRRRHPPPQDEARVGGALHQTRREYSARQMGRNRRRLLSGHSVGLQDRGLGGENYRELKTLKKPSPSR